MIAWCGSRTDGLGWLGDRCGSFGELEVSESLSEAAIDTLCNQSPRRLVLAVENRLSYPAVEIAHLQRSWPEIPWALAVGTWYDGSRRTGIGSTDHLSLPWYRWWDGWVPWLRGTNPALLDPWPRLLRSGLNRQLDQARSRGVIISNCRQTAEGWLAGLDCSATTTQLISLSEFRVALEQTGADPDWILWDDSCLDSFRGADCLSEVSGLFAAIRKHYPRVLVIAATCMPRWSDWHQWTAAGADELISKPSQSVLLRELMMLR